MLLQYVFWVNSSANKKSLLKNLQNKILKYIHPLLILESIFKSYKEKEIVDLDAIYK